jgi:hypothetical protein
MTRIVGNVTIALFIAAVLAVGGCSNGAGVSDDAGPDAGVGGACGSPLPNWSNSTCGMPVACLPCGNPGESCCKGAESSCDCAILPGPLSGDRKVCLGTGIPGLGGLPCTNAGQCFAGFACIDGYCIECGLAGEPCCDFAPSCRPGLTCHDPHCLGPSICY